MIETLQLRQHAEIIPDLITEIDKLSIDRTSVPQESLDLANKERASLFQWRSQFSPQLVELLLKKYSQSDSVVLDPFVGSGTTLFEAAIMETGYSTCSPFPPLVGFCIFFPEANQQDFVNNALGAIRQKVRVHSLSFITWYELLDEPGAIPPLEQHFGILHADFSQKIAYGSLKQQFSTFVNG